MRAYVLGLGCSASPQLLSNGQIPLITALRFVRGIVGDCAAIGAGCWSRTNACHRRCCCLTGGRIRKRERIRGRALGGAVAEIGPKGIVIARQQRKAVDLVGIVIEANSATQNRLLRRAASEAMAQ